MAGRSLAIGPSIVPPSEGKSPISVNKIINLFNTPDFERWEAKVAAGWRCWRS